MLTFATLLTAAAPAGTLDDLSCGPSATPSLPAAGAVHPSRKLFKKTIDTATYPNAICNDDSPGVYYVRQGVGADTSKWLIHLQGGFSCETYAECENRWCSSFGNRMTSDFEVDEVHVEGLFDRMPSTTAGQSAGNGFANWNVVVVKYCSQDVHTGSNVATLHDGAASLTIPFRGRDIVAATLKELQAGGVEPDVRVDSDGDGFWDEMPDLDQASHVVFTGSSAGGAGVTQLADKVRSYLRNTNPSVAFRAVVDAATVPDPYPLAAAATVDAFHQDKYDARTAVWDAFFDASCLVTYAADPKQCTDPATVMHEMGTPLFVRADGIDSSLFDNFVAAFSPTAPFDEADYAAALRSRLQDLNDTHVGTGGQVTRVFAPVCHHHETFTDSDLTYDQWLLDGTTPVNAHDAIWAWATGTPHSALLDDYSTLEAINQGSASCTAP